MFNYKNMSFKYTCFILLTTAIEMIYNKYV